jgi:hypothetical protein
MFDANVAIVSGKRGFMAGKVTDLEGVKSELYDIFNDVSQRMHTPNLTGDSKAALREDLLEVTDRILDVERALDPSLGNPSVALARNIKAPKTIELRK